VCEFPLSTSPINGMSRASNRMKFKNYMQDFSDAAFLDETQPEGSRK
jgi:hypothetical protein